MSRCFPYPPPGYVVREALVGSIKLQKESQRAKEEKKKEEWREKKEKKHRSKEERRKVEDKKHSNKKRHHDETRQLDKKVGQFPSRGDQTEQLEKSDLTEEWCQPAAQYMCDSPDSVLSSRKRIKHGAADDGKNNHGSVFFIPPLLKQKEPEIRVSSEQPCFSGRTEAALPQEETRTAPDEIGQFEGYRGSSRSRRKEAKFRDLVVKWNPQLQLDPEEDDHHMEWLFCDEGQLHEHGKTRHQDDVDVFRGCGSALCSWPPRASHLPKADVYALPFVVPF